MIKKDDNLILISDLAEELIVNFGLFSYISYDENRNRFFKLLRDENILNDEKGINWNKPKSEFEKYFKVVGKGSFKNKTSKLTIEGKNFLLNYFIDRYRLIKIDKK